MASKTLIPHEDILGAIRITLFFRSNKLCVKNKRRSKRGRVTTASSFEGTQREFVLFFTSLIRYKGDMCARLSCTRTRARDLPFRSPSFVSRRTFRQKAEGREQPPPRQRGTVLARGLEYRPTRAHTRPSAHILYI